MAGCGRFRCCPSGSRLPLRFLQGHRPLVKFLCSLRLILPRQPPTWLPGIPQIWGLNCAVYILPYIDDFLGALTSKPRLQRFSQALQLVCLDLGLTLKTSKSILESTAQDLETQGKDPRTGAGLINAFEAVKAAVASK